MSVQPPSNVNFSPDGAFVTFLDCPFGSKVKELFAVNLATKVRRTIVSSNGLACSNVACQEVTSIVKPQNDGNTEQTLSFEEKMRRERLRDLSIGVTDYSWCASDGLGRLTAFPAGFEMAVVFQVTKPRLALHTYPTAG
jgi:dipeptidyl-peptidase 4